ncbi:MAG: PIN domain-containing protein [Burkholderiaceae bacterium]|nr:MAG: PIN domain-containing protein [Burkholderiaceae bacterium]
MIGIDTNVLMRYIAQDDPAQSRRATAFIENECSPTTPGFVGLLVLAEVVWVSESVYEASREEVAHILRRILGIRQLVVEDAETAWKALRLFEASQADFSDCLIACSASKAGCESVVSFDKQAAKMGMTLLK